MSGRALERPCPDATMDRRLSWQVIVLIAGAELPLTVQRRWS
jgi:hypothetical protein